MGSSQEAQPNSKIKASQRLKGGTSSTKVQRSAQERFWSQMGRWHRLDRWDSNSGAGHFEPHNRRVWASDRRARSLPGNLPRLQWKIGKCECPSQAYCRFTSNCDSILPVQNLTFRAADAKPKSINQLRGQHSPIKQKPGSQIPETEPLVVLPLSVFQVSCHGSGSWDFLVSLVFIDHYWPRNCRTDMYRLHTPYKGCRPCRRPRNQTPGTPVFFLALFKISNFKSWNTKNHRKPWRNHAAPVSGWILYRINSC